MSEIEKWDSSKSSVEWKRANAAYDSAQHALNTAQHALDTCEKLLASLQERVMKLAEEQTGKKMMCVDLSFLICTSFSI